MDGAGSYSVAHRAGLLPTELTGMWGWILLRSPHQGTGSPPPPPSLSNGLHAMHMRLRQWIVDRQDQRTPAIGGLVISRPKLLP